MGKKTFSILLFSATFSTIFLAEVGAFAYDDGDPNLSFATTEKAPALSDLNVSSPREAKNCHLLSMNYVSSGKKSYEAAIRIDFKDQIGSRGVNFILVHISDPLMKDSELLRLQGVSQVKGAKIIGKTVLHGASVDHLDYFTKSKICDDWVSEPSMIYQPRKSGTKK